MEFEFDPRKSTANKHKHDLEFVEAQVLWDDADLLEIPVRTEDEPRFLVIGLVAGEHWSGVITHRGELIRIISLRQARKEEVEAYES